MTSLPFFLRRLRELGALTPATEQALVTDGVLTLADYLLAVADRRPSVADQAIHAALPHLDDDVTPLTLGRGTEVLESFVSTVAAACRDVNDLQPSGDVRRFEQLPDNLLLVGHSATPPAAIATIATLPGVTDVLHRTGRRVIVQVQGHEVDVRISTPDEFGSLLFTTTGPPSHVVEIHRRRGPRISATEEQVYAQAGLAFLPPELRGTPGAIDAAVEGRVPGLVTQADIRGDLHMHTTFSDGQNPLADMVHACAELGYEYIAITDHSEHAAASRTLTTELLARQRDQIARLREEYPRLAILHGIEADILPDGRIDCPDAVMATLDIVLASLHERAGQDGRQLTARCLRAIQHPLVTVITHPMNQLVGHRAAYDMDFAAIYEAAAETGTVLEIDGAPAHLDMDGEHARAAIEAGVTVSIDSDCHRGRSLERQMRLGVGTARRGWVEPRHVLNARPLAQVLSFIAQKRG